MQSNKTDMQLNLPLYDIKLKVHEGKRYIFDTVRRKFLVLTPEEWVRQNFIHYMVKEKGYPASLLSIEHSLKLNTMQRRADIVAYNSSGMPRLIVECKATSVKIDQKVFDQIARYNISLQVPFLIVTNGMQHFCCKIDLKAGTYNFLKNIPHYKDIC